MSGPFVVLATQRSGSTWVVDKLDSHPSVTAYSELFLEGGRGRPTWGGSKDVGFWDEFSRGRRSSPSEERRALDEYLDEVLTPRSAGEARGFKLMHGQLGALPAIWQCLLERRARLVHLVRRNVLDVVVSKESAVQRDAFHARRGDDVARVRVRLDVSQLVRRLDEQEREREDARRRIADTGLEWIEVAYEQLRDEDGAFGELLDFLQVGRAKLTSTLRRMNTQPRSELVENWPDVCRVLAGTRFAACLEEP